MAKNENQQTLEAYERNIQAYVQGTPQIVDGPYREWIDAFLGSVAKDARILEIGSAFGRDADYIESQGYKVERTDAAQGFVDLLQEGGHSASLLNAINDELGGPYDLILANAVFLHFTIEQTKLVVAKCHAALMENGSLAFSVKQGEGNAWKSAKLGAPKYYQFWSKENLEAMLVEQDFQIIEIRSISGQNSTKWLNVIARVGKTS